MSNLSPTNPQPQPLTEFELDLLKQEYFFLQTTIEDYHKQIWAIKALGITVSNKAMLVPKTKCAEVGFVTKNWLYL